MKLIFKLIHIGSSCFAYD